MWSIAGSELLDSISNVGTFKSKIYAGSLHRVDFAEFDHYCGNLDNLEDYIYIYIVYIYIHMHLHMNIDMILRGSQQKE